MKEIIHNATQGAATCGRILSLDYTNPKQVIVTDYKALKTEAQLKYAHSLIGFYAKHHSITAEQGKIDTKSSFGIFKLSTSMITGERTIVFKSFKKYRMEEIEVFITQLEHYCDSNHIKYIAAKK